MAKIYLFKIFKRKFRKFLSWMWKAEAGWFHIPGKAGL